MLCGNINRLKVLMLREKGIEQCILVVLKIITENEEDEGNSENVPLLMEVMF